MYIICVFIKRNLFQFKRIFPKIFRITIKFSFK